MNHSPKFGSDDMVFWGINLDEDMSWAEEDTAWVVEYGRFDDILAAYEAEQEIVTRASRPPGLISAMIWQRPYITETADRRHGHMQPFLRACTFSSRVVNYDK